MLFGFSQGQFLMVNGLTLLLQDMHSPIKDSPLNIWFLSKKVGMAMQTFTPALKSHVQTVTLKPVMAHMAEN